MPRVTHVKKAQQRYATKVVLGEDGQPVKIPLRGKTNKRGEQVYITRTVEDRDQPLPPEDCDFFPCQHEGKVIWPGEPYKHMTPRSGPYGGVKRSRHEEHPSWNTWEYSSSLSARLDQVQYNAQTDLDTTGGEEGDFKGVADALAEGIRELADEKREAAESLESGFGHETQQSMDLAGEAAQLEAWADEAESFEEEAYPEPDHEFEEPEDDEDEDLDPNACANCGEPRDDHSDEPTEDEVEAWRSACEAAVQELIDGRPL